MQAVESRTIFKRWSLILVSLAFFSGCSMMSQKPVAPVVKKGDKQQLWKLRQASLINNNSWSLNSKIALQFGEENWIFGLDWVQRAARQYSMQIRNPLTGAMVAKLSEDKQGAVLVADNGKTYRSKDAEQLLQSQSGLNLPLKGMQFWVRGISSPQYKIDKLVLDNLGRPQSIQQAGWLIQYSAYQNAASKSLPQKVVFRRAKENINVKLVAKQWQGI